MRMSGNRFRYLAACIAALTVLALGSMALQGCGKDQAKQDFVNGLLSIIEDNQADSQVGEAGKAAFQQYFVSGFTDLASAQAAADSFQQSNDKDRISLGRIDQLNRPDGQSTTIAEVLQRGIITMDQGNSVFIEELGKAPGQTVEERSRVFENAAAAMGYYLEGLNSIISSLEDLKLYVQEYKLKGEDSVQVWIDKFKAEKKSIEDSMRNM